MTLAKRLKWLRRKSNISMAEAARQTMGSPDKRGRVTQGYLSRLESGKENNPSMLKIITLAQIYGVDPNTITGWRG